MKYNYWELVQWNTQGKAEYSSQIKKPLLFHLCTPQSPHTLTWNRTRKPQRDDGDWLPKQWQDQIFDACKDLPVSSLFDSLALVVFKFCMLVSLLFIAQLRPHLNKNVSYGEAGYGKVFLCISMLTLQGTATTGLLTPNGQHNASRFRKVYIY